MPCFEVVSIGLGMQCCLDYVVHDVKDEFIRLVDGAAPGLSPLLHVLEPFVSPVRFEPDI